MKDAEVLRTKFGRECFRASRRRYSASFRLSTHPECLSVRLHVWYFFNIVFFFPESLNLWTRRTDSCTSRRPTWPSVWPDRDTTQRDSPSRTFPRSQVRPAASHSRKLHRDKQSLGFKGYLAFYPQSYWRHWSMKSMKTVLTSASVAFFKLPTEMWWWGRKTNCSHVTYSICKTWMCSDLYKSTFLQYELYYYYY